MKALATIQPFALGSALNRLFLIPGYMTDQTLWQAASEILQGQCAIEYISLHEAVDIDGIARRLGSAKSARNFLCGFSMGGYVTREIARRAPDHVSGVILVSSSCRADTLGLREARRRAATAANPTNFRGLSSTAIKTSLSLRFRNDSELVESIRRMGAGLGYKEFVRQSAVVRESDYGLLAAIGCPVLIITGDEDEVRAREESEELAAGITNATLRIVSGAGHLLPLEQPAAFADAVLGWINALPIATIPAPRISFAEQC